MKYHLGFLGGGQLARMSIQAAQRMGLRCISLDASDRTPAAKIADFEVGALYDSDAIRSIFDVAEMVTLENEFIPAKAIEKLGSEAVKRLVPNVEALATIQDKLSQRKALIEKGVPSPKAVPLVGDGEEAVAEIGFPMVLKARFGGYDGKGTRYAKTLEDLFALKAEWGSGHWLAEQYVPFKRELAVMVVARGAESFCFPTVETVQTNSVCDLVFPCYCDASQVALDAVKAMEGVGLFGVELFQLENGTVLVNEIAPRPHNSGHYTLDWGGPSQFEFHVRAVLGLPISQPESSGFAVMANLLGQPGAGPYEPGLRAALQTKDAFVHWYDKDEAKPGRKMGHINIAARGGEDVADVVEAARDSRAAFYRAWSSK